MNSRGPSSPHFHDFFGIPLFVFVLVCAMALSGWAPWRRLHLVISDWMVSLAPTPKVPFEFAQVLIDASSLNLDFLDEEDFEASPALRALSHGWPWPRSVYAEATQRILEAGAELVILDVLLPGAREGDAAFRRVLEEYPGRIVLVSNFVEDAQVQDGAVVMRYQPPSDSLVSAVTAVGFANFWQDQEDGVVRSANFRARIPGGEMVHSSPAVALGLLKGPTAREALPDVAHFIPSREGLSPDVRIPFWQVISPREWAVNLDAGAIFRGRVVVIGASAQEMHDTFQTPLGTYPGAGLHLAALAAAWGGAFYVMPSSPWIIAAIGVGCELVALIRRLARSTLLRTGLVFLGLVLAIPGGLALLVGGGVMPPLLAFGVGAILTLAGYFVVDLTREIRERIRTRNTLERYVSPALAREILDEKADFLQSLGGVRREVTILFSDVRGFTARTESSEPRTLFSELNEYFGLMVADILASGGAVDKFLGDGILAAWGTLGRMTPEKSARAAVECAQAMQKSLEDLNALRAARGLDPWRIGIGLHSGDVLFGNIGSKARMEPTMIGDTVNVASRVEGLTKTLACGVLVTESTRTLTGNPEIFRSADLVRVVGRSEPVRVFTFWDADCPSAVRILFEEAIRDFRRGHFSEAQRGFSRVLDSRPADGLCLVYLDRCGRFLKDPPPSDWGGVFEARGK